MFDYKTMTDAEIAALMRNLSKELNDIAQVCLNREMIVIYTVKPANTQQLHAAKLSVNVMVEVA